MIFIPREEIKQKQKVRDLTYEYKQTASENKKADLMGNSGALLYSPAGPEINTRPPAKCG